MKVQIAIYYEVISKKLVSFLLVGGTTAIIYLLICSILYEHYQINNFISVSVAYFVAVSFHFLANRFFTFKAQGMKITHQLKNYCVLLGVSYSTMILFTQGACAMQLSPYLGMLAAVFINFIITYMLCNFWVFRKNIQINQ